MSAREILSLRHDFTPEQLKANFRALALHLHPDKTSLPPQEANALFQRLIAAYTELRDGGPTSTTNHHHLGGARGEGDARQFHDLREGRGQGQQPPTRVDESLRAAAAASLGGSSSSSSSFDIHRFNTVFDRTRVRDASTDDGYEGWMQRVTPDEITAQHLDRVRQGVQAYSEPEPLVSCRGLQFTEIGQGRVKDYGRGLSAVGQGHALAFSDYRSAHSTDSVVIHPATARPRTSFGNMLELESARAAPSAPLTPDELRARAEQERQVANSDARRLRTLRKQDVVGLRHQAAVTAALLSLGS